MSFLGAGERFANRFEIERVAGVGGMGTVYRARDLVSGDWVALKLLQGLGNSANESERFAREARILSELDPPAIVSYVAHGQTPRGERFLVMQWLDGEDLAQRLSRGPLSLPASMALLERIASALAFAHQRRVIHRDIKPTNLFLVDRDLAKAKVLDFGIARFLDASRAMTRTGMVIGTPEYMSPEQARGARELTPAADVFSLGCVLYECLTGEPPFVADHVAAVLVRILFEEPVPIEQRRPGIPEGIRMLIERMLLKDPAQRIANFQEVLTALAALDGFFDSPFSPTLVGTGRAVLPQADSEQVLLSLVLAVDGRDIAGGRPTLVAAEVTTELEQRAQLIADLRKMGCQADFLVSGALVSTIPPLSSAQDQAVWAAKVALLVRERWPTARVAVVNGRGSRSRGLLSGEVLNRAWRLLSHRPTAQGEPDDGPASILLDEASAGLLDTRFDISRIESGTFVLRALHSDVDEARPLLGKPTPCVGRERELSLLDGIWSECRDESVARAALVIAPPGAGKSRLRHEFVRRLGSRKEETEILVGRGDPLSAGSPYGMLGQAMRSLCGVVDGEPLAARRDKLLHRLSRHLDSQSDSHVVEFLGELCGTPFGEDASVMLRAARQEPRIMNDQITAAALDWLQAECRQRPVLLILEDLHWGDGPMVRLLDTALRDLTDAPFMILALARPEIEELFPQMWAGRGCQDLRLSGLTKKASERLVQQVLGPRIAPEICQRIVEQANGNALFLEEPIATAHVSTKKRSLRGVCAFAVYQGCM